MMRGIVPACDMPIEKLHRLAHDTADIDGVTDYKIGLELVLKEGLRHATEGDNVVYNHCSGGCDIPAIGNNFMSALSLQDNIKGIILTPLAGPETQMQWTAVAKMTGLKVYIEP
ncbi:MAG: hypothetical protein ACE5DM_04315, partial [Candidatus Nanoarchaeia archaeon]